MMKYILLFIILVVFCLSNSYAFTYYVATNGDDTRSLTVAQNINTPWKTIQKAANNLVAGDIVYIRGGNYIEKVYLQNSGSASGGYITYAGYPNETATITWTNMTREWVGLFNILQKSYIKVSRLNIVNSPGFGYYMDGASNIQIQYCYTDNTNNSGVYMTGSNTVTIDGNEINRPSQGGDQTNGIQEALSVMLSNNVTVSNNRVHGGNMEGIDAKHSSYVNIFGNNVWDMARQCIYVDSYINTPLNINIYNNTCHDSRPNVLYAGGIVLGGEEGHTVSYVKVYNNVIYNIISEDGIHLSNYFGAGYWAPRFQNIDIYNNTIYKAGTAQNYYGGIEVEGTLNTNIVIRNNIFSNCGWFNIQSSLNGTTISNNLFDGGSVPAGSTNHVIGNPLFMNATGANFHLQSNSPAINAGLLTGAPTKDFDGVTRIGNPDIGAYESVLPDVIVTSLSYNSSTGIFTCVVKNQGTGATPAGTTVGVAYFVDGVYKTWGAVASIPLAPGASATVGSDGGAYTIPAGTHTIMAFVDDAGRFAESNETNNQLSQQINVGSNNLLLNPGFESGITSWWGANSTIATSTTKHLGVNGCIVTSRSSQYSGPDQVVTSAVAALGAGIYYLEAYVRMASGTSTVLLTLHYKYNNVDYYVSTPGVSVSSTAWTKVSGTVTVTYTGTLQTCDFYIQTTSGTTNYYADDCVLNFTGLKSASIATTITDINVPKISIYPNPVTSNLNIELSSVKDNERLQIFNTMGRLVKELKVSALIQQVKVEDLSNGVYFIRLTGSPNLSIKFIKQ
jgi:hypothetical protein